MDPDIIPRWSADLFREDFQQGNYVETKDLWVSSYKSGLPLGMAPDFYLWFPHDILVSDIKIATNLLDEDDLSRCQRIAEEKLQGKVYPITVSKNGRLIDGWHRVAVARRDGDEYIPALIGFPEELYVST